MGRQGTAQLSETARAQKRIDGIIACPTWNFDTQASCWAGPMDDVVDGGAGLQPGVAVRLGQGE